MPSCHIVVMGDVQGVYFRSTTKEVADRLGIMGWVRNTESGAVEIHAEGSEVAMNEFVRWCHRGPTRAKVDNVQCSEAPQEHFASFEIRR